MKRVIVTALFVLVCFLLQTSVFSLVELAGVTPNILLIFIASIAVMRGQKVGMWIGFFCGLLLDIFYGSFLGGYAFLYMAFGFVDGYFHRIYYSDDNVLPLLLIGANDLVYGLIMYVLAGLLQSHFGILYYVKNIILPELVYTVAVSLVLYQILLRVNDRLSRDEKRSADFV